MGAGPGLNRFDLEPRQPGGQPGRVAAGWWGPPGAAVADRPALLVGERDAPPGARIFGDPVGDVLAGLRGDWAEPADVAGREAVAEPGGQRHGQVDRPAQRHRPRSRPRPACRTGAAGRAGRWCAGRAGRWWAVRAGSRVCGRLIV